MFSLTDKKPVMLRLPQEVIDELKAIAKSQRRSVNNMIEVILADYLEHIEKR